MVDESQLPVSEGDEEPDAASGEGEGLGRVSDSEPTGISDSAGEAPSLKSSFAPGKSASATSKILVVLFATVLILGGIYATSPDELSDTLSIEREGFDEEMNRKMILGYKTPFLMPGIMQPEIRPTSEVRFAADCPAIGVTVGKASRVYPMITLMPNFTLQGENGQIVNDSLGGKLLTVINDVDAEVVRVFGLSETSSRKTIGLWLMGRDDGGGMLLTFDKESDFRLDQTEIPDLADYPFEVSTLSKWKAKHPETDVYVGEFTTPDLQMESTLGFMSATERIEADRVLKERDRQRKVLSPKRSSKREDRSKSAAGSTSPDGSSKPKSSPGPAEAGSPGKASSPDNRR